MLNLFQHPLVVRGLRITSAMKIVINVWFLAVYSRWYEVHTSRPLFRQVGCQKCEVDFMNLRSESNGFACL